MIHVWVKAVRRVFSLGLNGKEALIWWVGVLQAYSWLECRQPRSSVSSALSLARTPTHMHRLTQTHTHTALFQSTRETLTNQHSLRLRCDRTHTNREADILSPCHDGNCSQGISSLLKCKTVYLWKCKDLSTYTNVYINMWFNYCQCKCVINLHAFTVRTCNLEKKSWLSFKLGQKKSLLGYAILHK